MPSFAIARSTPRRSGKLYLLGLVLSVATSFTVSSTGGINPGHAFGLIVLLVAFGGVLAARLRWLGRAAPYASTFALSFSFLLSLVPGVNETLTRLPAAHPIAAAPMAPVVLHTLLGLAAVFVLGFAAQCWRMRSQPVRRRPEQRHLSPAWPFQPATTAVRSAQPNVASTRTRRLQKLNTRPSAGADTSAVASGVSISSTSSTASARVAPPALIKSTAGLPPPNAG